MPSVRIDHGRSLYRCDRIVPCNSVLDIVVDIGVVVVEDIVVNRDIDVVVDDLDVGHVVIKDVIHF
jgi:hypothetical protein